MPNPGLVISNQCELDKLLRLSVPPSSYLSNGMKKSLPHSLLEGVQGVNHVEHTEEDLAHSESCLEVVIIILLLGGQPQHICTAR